MKCVLGTYTACVCACMCTIPSGVLQISTLPRPPSTRRSEYGGLYSSHLRMSLKRVSSFRANRSNSFAANTHEGRWVGGREGARREEARREGTRREGARREGARREGARREDNAKRNLSPACWKNRIVGRGRGQCGREVSRWSSQWEGGVSMGVGPKDLQLPSSVKRN